MKVAGVLAVAVAMVGSIHSQTKVDYPTQIKNGPVVIDTAYATLQLGCDAAAAQHAELNVTKSWINVPTTICNAVVNFIGSSGSIQPASGATFTMNGYTAVNRQVVWDVSAGGHVRLGVGAAGTSVYAGNFTALSGACEAAAAAPITGGTPLIVSAPISIQVDTTCAANVSATSGGLLTVSTGVTLSLTGSFDGDLTQHFAVSGTGAIDLSAATISVRYPQWLGATCGSSDSTTAIQNTFNLRSSSLISIPCQMTTGNLYLPSWGGGIAISGNGIPSLGVSQSLTGGLKAKAGTTGALLSVYTEKTTMSNLILDCAHECANPLVLAEAQSSVITNVAAFNGTGSGIVFWNEGTPQTTTTSTITSGVTTVFTVANAALAGYPLSGTNNVGGVHCSALILGYASGTSDAATFSVAGNTITMTGTVPHTYAPGTTVQCHGNDNSMSLLAPYAVSNGGAGIDFVSGSDTNSIQMVSPNTFGNVGCGILGAGSTNKVVGGTFEGNGCVIQLGDATTRQTFTWDISTQDAESGLQVVISACDFWSSYHFSLESELVYATSNCGVQATMGWGYGLIQFGNIAEFIIKTISGISFIQPGMNGWQTYDSRVATFTNNSAVIAATNSFGVNQPVIFYTPDGTIPSNFTANKVYFVSATGLSASQFEVATTAGGTPIIAGSAGTGTQRVGAPVAGSSYTGNTSSTGAKTGWMPENFCYDADTMPPNHPVCTINDAVTGIPLTFNVNSQGILIVVHLANDDPLQIGANSIRLNGIDYTIGKASNCSSSLAVQQNGNSNVPLRWNNAVGSFCLDGQ